MTKRKTGYSMDVDTFEEEQAFIDFDATIAEIEELERIIASSETVSQKIYAVLA